MYKPQNIIQQLTDYIKKNLSKGYTEDTLKFSLISQGYSKISIDSCKQRFSKNNTFDKRKTPD